MHPSGWSEFKIQMVEAADRAGHADLGIGGPRTDSHCQLSIINNKLSTFYF